MMQPDTFSSSTDVEYMIKAKDNKHIVSSKTYYYRILYWITQNQVLCLLSIICTGCLVHLAALWRFHILESSPSIESLGHKQAAFNPMVYQTPYHNQLISGVEQFEYMPPDTSIDWHHHTTGIKAGFVVITREEEVFRFRSTIMDIEERFNHRYHYPWIIISDKPLSRKFREWVISSTNAPTYFGLAPPIEWNEPYWVDIKLAEGRAKEKVKLNVDHGESMSWRRMTRYAMGFLAHHPLLRDLEFYWKVQPGSQYDCDIPEDPFRRMKNENKKLSFSLTMTENELTLDKFEQVTKIFIAVNQHIIQPIKDSIYPALLNDDAEFKENNTALQQALGGYTGKLSNCLIWNNVMIVSLDFLKTKEYKLFFDTLDASGGFFYERWGDAFPQTIAAALFLNKNKIEYSSMIAGYTYSTGSVCPRNYNVYRDLNCTCKPFSRKVYNAEICKPKFLNYLKSN